MNRIELYHVVGLFLLAMMTLTTDFSGFTFPASIFSGLAQIVSYAVMVVAPSYVLADTVVHLTGS
ncbi:MULTISPECIES: hypothetical protein [unclassified Haloferax]|uniref:hypothetical protein n=1 Tax=Haloferax TaxID=2251 RepID=UPI0002AF7D83|nr:MULTISPECIES: hypothetical protein [unclassified Haloferax]ELZ56597.1 hypothetical protein C460_13379 [Haloferax sp. ATCC BAA-646]ELZ68042.1 hypothetical protein C459_00572 [Haloferax sp. ATCC BAA-645]ELZ68646.1 hypothetical protein C458_08505 [Haloferax sp. ATCC BAA-644]